MCGNLGLLLLKGGSNDDKAVDTIHVLHQMTEATVSSGCHGVGLTAFKWKDVSKPDLSASMVGVKLKARKRHPIARDLSKALKRKRGIASPGKALSMVALGHVWLPTSCRSNLIDLPPHTWVPRHKEEVWCFAQGTRSFQRMACDVTIQMTHSGDFQTIEMFGSYTTTKGLGSWLQAVLGHGHDSTGNSPKLAGVLDLLRVQGRWTASARLAYQRSIAQNKDCASKAPPIAYFEAWGKVFEAEFSPLIGAIIECKSHGYKIKSSKPLVDAVMNAVDANNGLGLLRDLRAESWSTLELKSFVSSTVRGFLRGDLYSAMSELLTRCQGTFGIAAVSTLEAGSVILASKGAPMSLSFDERAPLVLFGTEASAVGLAVNDQATRRLDMDERGQVIRLGAPSYLDDRGSYATATHVDKSGNVSIEKRVIQSLGWDLGSGITLRGYSLTNRAEQSRSELEHMTTDLIDEASNQWFLERPPRMPGENQVAYDLRSAPLALSTIAAEWERLPTPSSASHNQNVANEMGKLLLDALKARSKLGSAASSALDLLVIGTEASFWVGEQWVADLQETLPPAMPIRAAAVEAVALRTNSSFGYGGLGLHCIGPHTVILVISQSGQTYASLDAMNTLAALCLEKVFILTSIRNSSMEQALKQAYKSQEVPYSGKRVLNNCSGVCPAEATSLAIAAAHHTLTMLLLHCLFYLRCKRQALAIHPRISPAFINRAYSCGSCHSPRSNKCLIMPHHQQLNSTRESQILSPAEEALGEDILQDMNMIAKSIVYDSQKIVGACCEGIKLQAKCHQALVKNGSRWAQHVREYWEVLVYTGTYIMFSFVLQIPLCALSMQIMAIITKLCPDFCWADSMYLASTWAVPRIGIIGILLRFFDAILYIFIGLGLTKVIRILQGRQRLARMGKRNVIICDTPMVAKLLEAFLSKLNALSYSVSSIEVYAAKGPDDLMHSFTHRINRATLLAIGRPDGRLSTLSMSEAAVIAASRKASYIENLGCAPELLSVGHNPYMPSDILGCHVVLPANRRQFIDEALSGLTQDPNSGTDGLRKPPFGIYLSSPELKNFINSGLEPREDEKEPLEDLHDPLAHIALCAMGSKSVSGALTHQKLHQLQRFYERRIDALERFLAFSVVFHTMVLNSSHPWLRFPWDISTTQCSLRVATQPTLVPPQERNWKHKANLINVRKAAAKWSGVHCWF
ncbi:unnamed protein product [Chrysoparadoxa australica]